MGYAEGLGSVLGTPGALKFVLPLKYGGDFCPFLSKIDAKWPLGGVQVAYKVVSTKGTILMVISNFKFINFRPRGPEGG